jgi:hypothetical protein
VLVIVLQVISAVIFFNGCNNAWITALPIRCRTWNLGSSEEEQRANRNVEPKAVLSETLAVEDPSVGGFGGYLEQMWHATTSARSYHVNPAPGWSW